jgi:hypothetical protein
MSVWGKDGRHCESGVKTVGTRDNTMCKTRKRRRKGTRGIKGEGDLLGSEGRMDRNESVKITACDCKLTAQLDSLTV